MNLPPALRYFPLDDGRYHVRAGLRALPDALATKRLEDKVFQFDATFAKYRANKEQCRAEGIASYYLSHAETQQTEQSIAFWIAKHLAAESPKLFALRERNSSLELQCKLSSEVLCFDSTGELQEPDIYNSLFDAVSSQVQEDLAIVTLAADCDSTSSLHICSPNHWAPSEKFNKSFVEIHQPIAEIAAVNAAATQLVRAMIYKPPYERFAWGLSDDTKLNYHPKPNTAQVQGREFRGNAEDLFLRIERQTTRGFPELQAALFSIRTYFLPCTELSAGELVSLISALNSMTESSRDYKGLASRFEEVKAALVRRKREL